jgi:hypothetical protein
MPHTPHIPNTSEESIQDGQVVVGSNDNDNNINNTKKRARSRNFSPREDIWLCRVYMTNTRQKAQASSRIPVSTFWDVIKRDFQALQSQESSENDSTGSTDNQRDVNALYERFRKISRQVLQYLDIQKDHPQLEDSSDETDAIYRERLFHLFNRKHGGRFRFLACVEHLKDLPKYIEVRPGLENTVVEHARVTIAQPLIRTVAEQPKTTPTQPATIDQTGTDIIKTMDIPNVVEAANVISNMLKKKMMVDIWIAQRAYYMQLGNHQLADDFNQKLLALEKEESENTQA